MSDIRQRISSQQRMDMILKGLNPLHITEVKKYLESGGNVKRNQEATVERLKTLIGEDVFNKTSMGSANEKESEYQSAYRETGLSPGGGGDNYEDDFEPKTPQDFRKRTLSKLNEYGTAGIKDISPDQLLSLRKTPQQTPSINRNQDFKKTGYELSVKYLNAFIINLKDPSTKNRIELFKKLKTVLEYEGKLKNNVKATQSFKKGCWEAEEQMYNQLKS